MTTPLPIYTFEVGNGMVMHKLDSFRHTLKTLKPGRYALIVKKIEPSRSLNQNRLAFLWYSFIADEIGYRDPADVKFELQHMFLKHITESGKEVTRGTSDLNKSEFTEYLNKISEWAFEFHNITLPSPEFYGLVD